MPDSSSDEDDDVEAPLRSKSASPVRRARGQSFNDETELERKSRFTLFCFRTWYLLISVLYVHLTYTVSEGYHLKSKKGQRDERYKQRLKLRNAEKYKQRISRSTIRAKVWHWRRQLEDDLREKSKLERAAKQYSVISVHIFLVLASSLK